MRHLLTFALIMLLAGSAAAYDLGPTAPVKDSTHIYMDGAADGREGGDTPATAVVIGALPYNDSGATGGHSNSWDEVCPYTGSLSPDVWYSFTPAADALVDVDLFGSTYDTKTYILDSSMAVVACNDDFYSDYVSKIEAAFLVGGQMYYIAVDGYGSSFGSYVINVIANVPPEPCILTCNGVYPDTAEGEPDNGPGYVDEWNSGCNGTTGAFQGLVADGDGNLTFCGVSGWQDQTSGTRDTDWYLVQHGDNGVITWEMDAESETYGFELAPQDCATVAVAQLMTAGPCMPAVMVIVGAPQSIAWIWVGPTDYYPPAGFQGVNYDYVMTFSGLEPGFTATESTTFDSIKSMYR